MRYGSVCSGIEAATAAWHGLGWQPAWFSEIEPFPSAVLAHHYPTVPNLGDMTQFEEWPDESIDLLVGGTPCQSFSVAGLRKGLADPRGNLMLTYLAIAQRYRPRWLVWENVPGVLSSNGGRDFGTFLGALGELGYGFAYRVLDAQWFGVAQRRRRVFLVGYLGDWRHPAKVLFESESVCRDTPPSREKGQDITGCLDARANCSVGVQDASAGFIRPVMQETTVFQPIAMQGTLIGRSEHAGPNGPGFDTSGPMFTLTKTDVHAVATAIRTANTSSNGHGFSEECAYTLDQAQGQAVAQPINIYGGNKRPDRPEGGFYVRTDEPTSKTLDAASGLNPTCSQGGTAVMQATYGIPGNWIGRAPENGGNAVEPMLDIAPCQTKTDVHAVAQPVGFTRCDHGGDAVVDGTPTMRCGSNYSAHLAVAQQAMQVRRLTPVECERLQGFPDNYTNIPWRKKPESPDGSRYKSLGNSMAVPVMRWIGERIQGIENAQKRQTP